MNYFKFVSLFTRYFFTKKSSIIFGTALYDIVGTPIKADSAVIVPPDPMKTSTLDNNILSYDAYFKPEEITLEVSVFPEASSAIQDA